MEQARYWMWTKRKHDFSTHHHVLSSSNPSSFGDSTWEEQAFAEDAAGPLGGCIWPPRSYSCSFCRREFKSAQALGGHMNVHRRDRARLKQSPNPHGAAEGGLPQNHHHHILNPGQQISCTYLYKPNSDSDDQEFLTSPSSPITVSAPPTKIKSDDKTSSKAPPDFLSSINHEERKNNTIWSNLVAEKYFHVSDLKNEDKISKSLESTNRIIRAKGEYLKADLSVSLNLLVCRNQRSSASDDVAEETPISKRRRIDASSSFTLFPKISSPADQSCHLSHSEVLKNSPTSMEDLDLELRLGDPPKVK